MESDGIKNLDKLADKEKLKLIEAIEQASVTIIMTDADGNIQYGNPAFEKISGYSLKEAIGKNPRILKSGLTQEAVFEKMWKDITEGRAWEGELINKRKDGTIYYEEARITPIVNEDGKIVNFLAIKQDISKRKYLEEKLRQNSIRDSLTNIYNRGYLFESLNQFIELYKRKKVIFSLAILDIDLFKKINDTYGHQAGDYILKEFAEILTCSIRAYDVVGRYGGEEFMIIFQGVNKYSSEKIVNRILTNVRNSPFVYEGEDISITFSCGIADASEFSLDTISTKDIICEADKRLYEAKDKGRNNIVIE